MKGASKTLAAINPVTLHMDLRMSTKNPFLREPFFKRIGFKSEDHPSANGDT